MIKRYQVKSCCGKSNLIFQLDKAINKGHLKHFIDAGYQAPEMFAKHGVFHVRGHGIFAQASFGTTRVNVKCSGDDCSNQLNEFEKLLENILGKDG